MTVRHLALRLRIACGPDDADVDAAGLVKMRMTAGLLGTDDGIVVLSRSGSGNENGNGSGGGSGGINTRSRLDHRASMAASMAARDMAGIADRSG